MIRNEDELLTLVSDLHRGAIDEPLWTAALDRASDQFRGSAIVFGDEGDTVEDRNFISHRLDPQCTALICGALANPDDNPFLAAMPRLDIRRAILTGAACGDDALVRSRLYRDALQPFSQRFVLGGILQRISGRGRIVALVRDARAGDYDTADADLLTRLMPHLASALHLRGEVQALRGSAQSLVDALGQLDRGVVALDANGRALIVNPVAKQIFALDDGLRWRGGLVAVERSSTVALRLAMKQAFADRGGSAAQSVVVNRPSGRPPFVITILPAFVRHGPTLLLLIHDSGRERSVDRALVRSLYGLTEREAAVAVGLSRGSSLSEVAGDLAISLNTAKTHLKAIFEKTGVRRQPELVRRLLLDLGAV